MTRERLEAMDSDTRAAIRARVEQMETTAALDPGPLAYDQAVHAVLTRSCLDLRALLDALDAMEAAHVDRPQYERMEALLRWLADEGHVTPIATRQILSLYTNVLAPPSTSEEGT